ncbi:MAG: Crp/Fnr family transcriptional regulator [Candidatus Korobacteraceae bacterium]
MGIAIRSQGPPAKRVPPVGSVRSAKPATDGIAEPSRPRAPRPQLVNGAMAFDAETFLARAGLGRKILHLKKNGTAYAQGDRADSIFYVQKGQLRVTVTSTNGKEATLALVGAGEFLGENCMASAHLLHLATATAMTDCDLLRISKPEMVRVLHEEQELSDVFVSFLLTRNARIQADLVDQLFNSSEKRLARILLLLAQFGKESKPETVVPKISQETLAEMIGTTRSRVSFFMNRFRKLGFIEYNGEIRVHNTLLNIFLQE